MFASQVCDVLDPGGPAIDVYGGRRCVRELGRTGLRLRLDVPLTA